MKTIGLEPAGTKGTWLHEVKLPVPGKPASRFPSNNLIGRLRGSGKTGESVVFLAHWDHVGICGAPGAKDRICNGAVDNASGVAAMLEIARALAKGPKPVRDILFIATTGEEMGLLGASGWAAKPTVPLASIVAALNLDTVAISPKGRPVAVIGHGKVPALDALIVETALELGRVMDTDKDADEFAMRQDGYALARKGVPALMVGGSFSNMKDLEGFMSSAYHQPSDNPGPDVELGGATEDANLMVALARKLADPARYRR
jgi:Zn-dependent M28 family amino/carboxypeptidase